MRTTVLLRFVLVLLALFVLIPAVTAQTTSSPVTADDVNNVARQLYCPVCENVPLDVCPTQACAQWRDEIRIQLEAGSTSEQVINDFVRRYGDRVVGTPQDPTLRALSLVTPWIAAIMIVAIAVLILARWQRNRAAVSVASVTGSPAGVSDDDYRARLENDLRARR